MKSIFLAIVLFAAGLANADTIYSGTSSEKTLKIIPTYGIMTLKTDYESFNSKINTGVALEKMLSSRLSLGILFNYAKFNFNNSNYYSGYNNYGYNPYSYNYNYYGQGIKSEIFSGGINGKFFVLNEGMLRPFLGGGLTYNRNNLSYDYNDFSYNYNGQYTTSLDSFSGILMAGTELRFSRDFGLNFDFKYIRTLGNNSNYYYGSYSNLDYLGREMENSDLMSFNFGLLIAI